MRYFQFLLLENSIKILNSKNIGLQENNLQLFYKYKQKYIIKYGSL